MKSFAMVDGNLALAPAARTSAFQVIDGRLGASEHAPAHAPRRAEPDHLHIFIVAALIAVSLIGMIGVFQAQQAQFDAALAHADRLEIVVEPGDTLWTIAEDHHIDGVDTQQTVDIIRSWNSLSVSSLQPGDSIVVPA